MSKQKPLWTCPKCGNRFVTRNTPHSCGRPPLARHFAGKDAQVRRLYDGFASLVRECGGFTVVSQKTRICFMVRVRFASVTTRKHCLDVGLYLHRRIDLTCLRRVDSYAPRVHVHRLRLASLADLESARRELMPLLREAYAVGRQRDEAAGGALFKCSLNASDSIVAPAVGCTGPGAAREGHPTTPGIVEYSTSTEHHPTPEQILAAVNRRFPMTSRATVYSTLSLRNRPGICVTAPSI